MIQHALLQEVGWAEMGFFVCYCNALFKKSSISKPKSNPGVGIKEHPCKFAIKLAAPAEDFYCDRIFPDSEITAISLINLKTLVITINGYNSHVSYM